MSFKPYTKKQLQDMFSKGTDVEVRDAFNAYRKALIDNKMCGADPATEGEVPKHLHLYDLDLSGRDLSWSHNDQEGINLSGFHLHNCKLVDTKLAGCNLRGMELIGCDVWNTSFRKANLAGAFFKGCNLSGTEYHKANLVGFEVDKNCEIRNVEGATNLKNFIRTQAVGEEGPL